MAQREPLPLSTVLLLIENKRTLIPLLPFTNGIYEITSDESQEIGSR
jgi:hypothetical protein